jgi:hypothetical protein
MNKLMLLTLSLLATTTAFQIRPLGRPLSVVALKAKVDEAKIKDAAEHFGKYSVEEIQEMKDGEDHIRARLYLTCVLFHVHD